MPAAFSPLATRMVVILLALAGFAVAMGVFYPGILTFDAHYVYEDAKRSFYGDWQSPLMVWLWAQIDPWWSGTGGILALTLALYWLAFGIAGLSIATRAPRIAMLVPVLGFVPPAFVISGVIWRDVLFAAIWLLAALTMLYRGNNASLRMALRIAGVLLLCFGILLRPNAVTAAPLLAYGILAARWRWKWIAASYVPLLLIGMELVQLVYYGAFKAQRQNPLHSIMVFDIGGTSHFTKANLFPGTWSEDQTRQIANTCYRPDLWDAYWTQQPCLFVMQKLEREHVFGTPALATAWRAAVLAHPFAYVQHRLAYSWTFLFGSDNLAMFSRDLADPDKIAFADKPVLMALKTMQDTLKPTPLFSIGAWLILNCALCFIALRRLWRKETDMTSLAAFSMNGSAIAYVLTFVLVGVATDFRYGYWAVLTGLVSGALLFAERPVNAKAQTTKPTAAKP